MALDSYPLTRKAPVDLQALQDLAHKLASPVGAPPQPWVHARADRDLSDTYGSVTAVLELPTSRRSATLEPWLVRGILRDDPTSGRVVLVCVTVEHWPVDDRPPAELTGYVLQRIPLPTIRQKALAELRARPTFKRSFQRSGWAISDAEIEHDERIAARAADPASPPHRGRPGPSDDEYRHLAIRRLALGGTRGVLDALAAEAGLSRSTIRTRLTRACKLGFLRGGTQGRAYEPGPNLNPEGDSDA
jgi:hypothetical protein